MQERQRHRQLLGVGAVEAGAAEHDVGAVLPQIARDAVPQQLDRALVAVGRQHAGTAELEELQIAVARDQSADVEFARAVEVAILLRHGLPQQPIGADHRRAVGVLAVARGMIEHQEVIADRVIGIDVAAREQPARIGDGGTLLVENAIAQFLRLPHLGGGLRQPHLQRAEPAQALGRAMRARRPGLQTAIGLQRRNQVGHGGRWPETLEQIARRSEAVAACHGGYGSISARKRGDWPGIQATESAIERRHPLQHARDTEL